MVIIFLFYYMIVVNCLLGLIHKLRLVIGMGMWKEELGIYQLQKSWGECCSFPQATVLGCSSGEALRTRLTKESASRRVAGTAHTHLRVHLPEVLVTEFPFLIREPGLSQDALMDSTFHLKVSGENIWFL